MRSALIAALVVGVLGRLAYGYGAPLWFDETFSGVIATQPDFTRLLDWCLNELTGPAYYMPLWLWAKVSGSSDVALRLPSLILSIAAPLMILWRGSRDPALRRYWAILCLLWAPAFAAAWDARGYAQLFFLGAAQAILFLRLIERPTTCRAAAWTGVSALLLLTHYWSGVTFAVQALAFVAVHRRRALACWPAALLLASGRWMGLVSSADGTEADRQRRGCERRLCDVHPWWLAGGCVRRAAVGAGRRDRGCADRAP